MLFIPLYLPKTDLNISVVQENVLIIQIELIKG